MTQLAKNLLLLLCLKLCCGLAIGAQHTEPLLIATRLAPPFVIKTDSGWEGITIELLRIIAEEGEFDYRLREMGLEEMLLQTSQGRVDAAAAALTLTAEREKRLDFSHPFYTSGLGVAVPRRVELTWLSALMGVGSVAFMQATGALLGVLALVGVLVWLVERRSNKQFPGAPLKGVGSGIWWSAVTMTTVGYGDKAPQTLAGRILGLIWMFASVIIISSFTAAIATSLTVGQLDEAIRGVGDFHAKRVVTVKGSTSASFLDEKLVRYATVATVEDGLQRLAAGEADAVVYDLPILRYWVRERHAGELQVLPNHFLRQDYGIALPPGSPLRERFNRGILRIIQSNDWHRVIEGYLGPGE
ncbi:MAG: transporter substrate-binding domain-containing protein [Candidatus Thiodiazotropha sp.]|jgi:polar amino acid transport system substrate-binding protein